MRTTLLSIPLLVSFLSPGTSSGQSGWDPFAGVSQLVGWFSRLNEQVEQVVVVEKRGQLIRAIDRLRKDLYALEADARILLDGVPDSPPTVEEREHLGRLAGDLQQTVGRLTQTSRQVGADLRLNEAEKVEAALSSGLRTRGAALTYLQRAIEDSQSGRWDAPDIRSRLERGIEAVRAAQLAVTSFRQKLSKSS